MPIAWKGGMALCLALAALAGCGASDRGAVPTPKPIGATLPATLGPPTPPMTPATALSPTQGPTSPIPQPTPTRTTATQVAPVELPPTSALPLDRALSQFAGDALLYINSNGLLMLTDGQRELWLTSDDTVCEHDIQSFGEAGEWSPDGRWYLVKQHPQWLLYRADGTLVRRFDAGANREFSMAAWLPDSQRIVISMNEVISSTAEVILADVEGRQTVLATYPHTRIGALAVAPDSDLLAVSLGSHTVILDPQGRVQAVVGGWPSGWWPRR